MIRKLCMLLALVGAATSFAFGEPRQAGSKSPAQQMLEQAEKAAASNEVHTGNSGSTGEVSSSVGASAIAEQGQPGRPIVTAAKRSAAKPVEKKPDVVAPVKAVAPAAGSDDIGPVKIVEGSGSSKTTLAPVAAVQRPGNQVTGVSSRPNNVFKTPISSTGLPGLGAPEGAPGTEPAKPVVIHARNGVAEVTPLSMALPNRIQTPFRVPVVIDFSQTDYKIEGSDIYIVPKSTAPFQIYIRDKGPNSPVITLLVKPVPDIPGVTVLANIDGGYRPSTPGSEDKDPAPSSYEEALLKVMRLVAQEHVPNGYTETNLDVGGAMVGPLRIVPEKELSGTGMDVYRYRIINTGKESIELTEESFYQEGVKAVAFFPLIRLDPWQSTKAIIVTGKKGNDNAGD